MADVTVDPKSENITELTQQGVKAYILKDYDVAITALCRVIELKVKESGEKHDSLGQVYLYYGKSLLELSREESEALGDAVVPKELKDSESSDDDDEEAAEPETQKEKNGDDTKQTNEESETKNESKEQPSEVAQGDAVEESASSNKGGDEPGCSTTSNGQSSEENEEPSDLQLAWEVLEIAKMIFEERGDSGKKDLAETLITLGEISLEDENLENAIADMKKGLAIQQEIFEGHSRITAGTFYNLAIALSLNNQVDEAVQNFTASIDLLTNRLNELNENKEANKDEIEEIEQLIPEIKEKITDIKSSKEEVTKKITEFVSAEPDKITTTKFEGSSAGTVSNISHLVKRKRKLDEITGDCEENASKKVVSSPE